MGEKFTSVDDYIHAFPEEIQALLVQMRQTIQTNAPGADESISVVY